MLTINQVMAAARDINSPYANQVMGALMLHADWQRRDATGVSGRTDETRAFAIDVLNNPDAYTFRFAARCGLNPAIKDAYSDVNALPDQVVLDRVQEYFPLYAPDLPAVEP